MRRCSNILIKSLQIPLPMSKKVDFAARLIGKGCFPTALLGLCKVAELGLVATYHTYINASGEENSRPFGRLDVANST